MSTLVSLLIHSYLKFGCQLSTIPRGQKMAVSVCHHELYGRQVAGVGNCLYAATAGSPEDVKRASVLNYYCFNPKVHYNAAGSSSLKRHLHSRSRQDRLKRKCPHVHINMKTTKDPNLGSVIYV